MQIRIGNRCPIFFFTRFDIKKKTAGWQIGLMGLFFEVQRLPQIHHFIWGGGKRSRTVYFPTGHKIFFGFNLDFAKTTKNNKIQLK